ncbi:hypothetical protein J1N35_001604 [Gossypium stocksii]|uniref:Uncharacterized protein n=1 Tax=Gossypium stocksii TaxID=47602 RepID=A0A9D3WJU6_9ROSI|nr:hypothetical protein J1N35_001604 [Gossypium stocksii]
MTDLFVEWFVDKSENFGNAVHERVSNPLDLNISAGQRLPLSPTQWGPTATLCLSGIMRLVREQMVAQEVQFKRQQAFQQELLK